MKAKRIVMAVAVLIIVLAMACALVSCDLFGGGSGGGDDTPTYFVYAYSNINSAGSITGYGEYKKGDTVTLTATVNRGYVFVGWQNDSNELISTDTVYSFVMGDENMTFYTIFYDCSQVKLECDWRQGSVTGEEYYDVGSSVTITATANIGYIFAGWYEGDKLISDKPTYTFIKDDKYTVYTAKFNVDPVYEMLKLERLSDGTYKLTGITDKLITEIVIPSYISIIDSSVFEGCSGLTSITLPFVGAELGGTSDTHFGYIFGASYNSNNADYVPKSLKKVIITSGDSIGSSAFRGCSSLASVTIPDSVKSIGDWAFRYCSSLTSITIPNSVTSIDTEAFYYCDRLTSVTFENTSGWFVTENSDATSGTDVTVTDPSQNAKNLTDTYYNYYWKRK